MDPTANLREQRDLVRCIVDSDGDPGQYHVDTGRDLATDVLRLAELVQALDQWMTGGGFRPRQWMAP